MTSHGSPMPLLLVPQPQEMRGFGDLLWPCAPRAPAPSLKGKSQRQCTGSEALSTVVGPDATLSPHRLRPASGCGLQSPISLSGSASVSREHLSSFVKDGVFVPRSLQIHVEAPIPRSDAIWRWGLWEVMGVRGGPEGGPRVGLSAFIRGREQSSLSAMRACSKKPGRALAALTENKIRRRLDPGLAGLQDCVNKCVLPELPTPWCFVRAARMD